MKYNARNRSDTYNDCCYKCHTNTSIIYGDGDSNMHGSGGANKMECRIKKIKKEYVVYINDKKDRQFMNLDLALDYIKRIKGAKKND